MAKTTTYVALLRGINVGGKARVEMARLKQAFERIGLHNVSTYINSGNVMFRSENTSQELVSSIEAEIEKDFRLQVPVVVRSLDQIHPVNKKLPSTWLNNSDMKTYVLFLWEDVDSKEVIDTLPIRPQIDDVIYVAGAVIWNVSRKNQPKSGLVKIIGTPLYKRVTIRNANTVRILYERMQATDKDELTT